MNPESQLVTGMNRSGHHKDGQVMMGRLQRLQRLVQNGVLTSTEADAMRVKVLAAEQDLTLRLTEAEGLCLEVRWLHHQ